MSKSFLAVQVGIILILQTKVVGLTYFIQISTQKDFGITSILLTGKKYVLSLPERKLVAGFVRTR